MKHSKSNKWRWWWIDLAGLTVCVAVTLVVYCVSIRPLIDERKELRLQEGSLAKRRQEASNLSTSLNSVKQQLDEIRRELEASPLKLQSSSVLNERLKHVNDLASETDLQINEVHPGRRYTGDHFHTVSIFVAGKGTYRTCAQFLHRLHESFKDTAVVSFDLRGNSARGNAAQFQFDLAWYVAPLDGT